MRKYLLGAALFTAAVLAFLMSPANQEADAANSSLATIRTVPMTVITDNRITSNGSITGDYPVLLIANASSTASHKIQELKISNPDAADTLCMKTTTTTTYCSNTTFHCNYGGTAGQMGDVILPGKAETFYVTGDRRICGLSSASPTSWHISRYQFN